MSDIPEDVIQQYKFQDIAKADGYVYCRVEKGMYGLPQSGIIAQDLLEERLAEYGYSQSQLKPGLWKHEIHPTIFTIVLDNFAIKYLTDKDALHLMTQSRKNPSAQSTGKPNDIAE